jgi:SIR2-like domain
LDLASRDELLATLSESSLAGYLGLFVGSGFSKAATEGLAPTFRQLLDQLVGRLRIEADLENDPEFRFKSFPQVASALLVKYASASTTPQRASERFKEAVGDLCNLKPEGSGSAALTHGLRGVGPSWIITTNYDFVLEMLLDGTVTVLPDQPLIPRSDRVPILHLHGHRLRPSSIKITEEDYVTLLGPIDYQRLKLPLLLAESSTVMLGYALGDMNVRAAMEWSRSFKASQGLQLSRGQGVVVQALYVPDSPRAEPYIGPNGEFVVEIADISAFLTELSVRRTDLDSRLKIVKLNIDQFLSNPQTAVAVGDSGPERAQFLNILDQALPYAESTKVLEFLDMVLDPIWERARMDGGFAYYDIYMHLLLDVLEKIRVEASSPALIVI